MASNDLTILTIHQVKSAYLNVIRDTVKELYKVKITEITNSTSNEIPTNIINDSSLSKSNYGDAGTPPSNKHKQVSSAVVKTSSTPQQEKSVVLHFEGDHQDVSVEEIEKAKNFVRVHLLPGPDYTTDTHSLENQLEFNMVLESSQHIQAATTALLTFDPRCLEVTLHGSPSTVASARSKVVVILDKLREQTRTENSIDFKSENTFYENLLLDNFVEKQNHNDSSKLSRIFVNGSNPTENRKLMQFKPKENTNIGREVSESQNWGVYQNKTQPNWLLIQPDSFDDIETDCAQSPNMSPLVVTAVSPVHNTPKTQWRKPPLSISSGDESSCEENILTDPRYSKKIEQAMKLGYSEKQVMKALVKVGPECALNDLLSELIKLGTSDAVLSDGQSLSPESNVFFSNDTLDFGLDGSQRLNVMRTEPRDSTDFSSSTDFHGNHIADISDSRNLRDVIIDGSNVAMSHGKKVFSCKGIQIAVNWFKERGHKNITAFIPQWRKEASRPDAPITDQEILSDLEKEGIVVFTPARRVKGRRVVCYDDRYVLKLAVETDGIVVSNDVYRDLVNEREDFRKVVDQKLLMYSFVNDRFMPPEDPLGRLGPTLDNFLRKIVAEPTPKPQDCPYGKKCTYGNKCRFYHRERGFAPQKLITETLKEQADLKLLERATRLSEIAEKGKRSKQKLSRTKSLIPWDPMLSSVNTQVSGNGSKNKQEKPKLSHSKSLVLPTKSCDYLNEPRKKLEEAELVTALKMSAQDTSFQQQYPSSVSPHDDSEHRSKTKSPIQRSSPGPQKDSTKQIATSGDIISKSSFPTKSVNTNSPRVSPSHLTVPKPEPPERYLSGHLYLAKKLSDESVESNFFSEHTSSPSSTRTSSPVVALSKIPEQTQFSVVDTHSKNRQVNFPASFTSPPPFHPSLLQQHQQMTYSSQAGHHDIDIPNLSIFDQGVSNYSNKCGSTDTLSTYKQDIVDNTQFTDYAHQKINCHSPDNQHYNSTESILNSYQNVFQPPKAYPFFQPEDAFQSSDRVNLRRAFSSTGNFKTAEDLHQKLDRRASGVSSSNFGEEHFVKKPQSGHLLDTSSLAYQFGHSYGLNRQNSSSDPQMHVDVGEVQDILSPISNSGDFSRNFKDLHSTNSQHFQTQQNQQRHFENQQQIERLKHLQQQQQDVSNMSSQLSKPRVSGVWGEPAKQPNLGHRSSIGGTTQNHYNPLQSHPLTPNVSHMSHFPSTTSSPNMVMASTYSPTSPYLPPHHYQPSMMYATTQHDPSAANIFPTTRRQSFPHSNYPQHHRIIQSNPFFGGIPDHHQITPNIQPVSIPFIIPEDTPIVPEDPRYTIYYHLSNVFGEQVVRIVMNRNPNEQHPNNVCKLILQYKEETGL